MNLVASITVRWKVAERSECQIARSATLVNKRENFPVTQVCFLQGSFFRSVTAHSVALPFYFDGDVMPDEKSPNVCTSLAVFLYKIRHYNLYGYHRYVMRQIPEQKDPSLRDKKIMDCYGVTFSRMKRFTRKKKGLANVMYLRHKNTFLLLATDGIHEAFDKLDSKSLHESAILYSGYKVSFKNHKPRIHITERRMTAIKKYTREIMLHNHGRVTSWLKSISPFYFSGVGDQRWKLYLEVNKKRKAGGLKPIRWCDIKPRKFKGGYK